MSLQVIVGSSILALLLAEVSCLPVKHDGYYRHFAPPTNGNHQINQLGYYQPAVQPRALPQKTLAAPKGVGLAQQEPASQTGPQVSEWAVAPPAGHTQTEAAESAYVSPPVLPPEPQFQAGDLYHYKTLSEHGQSEYETEERGHLLPPPPLESPQSVVSQPPPPPPKFGPGLVWGVYPPYTHMFLTGQIPVGKLSHFSASYERGNDNWGEVHYEKYDYPSEPIPPSDPTTQKVFPSL